MSVARFPIEKRDGPIATKTCRCGHADYEHNPRKYGFPCRACPACPHFEAAARDDATPLPPQRQDAASVAAVLNRIHADVLSDALPIRPNLVVVVLLNETDSWATWGPGSLSTWDEADAHNQIGRMASFARGYHAAREWNEAHPEKPRELPERQQSARGQRLDRKRLETRMAAVDVRERPFVCHCKEAFRSGNGLKIHARSCHSPLCPTCEAPSIGTSFKYSDRTRHETHRCKNDHRWERTLRRPQRRATLPRKDER